MIRASVVVDIDKVAREVDLVLHGGHAGEQDGRRKAEVVVVES